MKIAFAILLVLSVVLVFCNLYLVFAAHSYWNIGSAVLIAAIAWLNYENYKIARNR